MKYFVVFLLCCVALAAAAPQFITAWPGIYAPGVARTVVAGPTVVNGFDAAGVHVAHVIHPGVVGPAFI